MIKEGKVDSVDFFTAVWEDGALEDVVVEPINVKYDEYKSRLYHRK